MENILFFLDASKKIGASPKGDLFIPLDLFELKNINKVIDGLIAFADAASKRLSPDLIFDLDSMGEFSFSQTEMYNVAARLADDKGRSDKLVHGEEYYDDEEITKGEEEEEEEEHVETVSEQVENAIQASKAVITEKSDTILQLEQVIQASKDELIREDKLEESSPNKVSSPPQQQQQESNLKPFKKKSESEIFDISKSKRESKSQEEFDLSSYKKQEELNLTPYKKKN